MVAATLVASIIWIDESFAPVLLARKANKVRFETKNWAIHSKSQENGTSFRAMARKYLMVPLDMLIDPIAFFINLYSAFCYAIIYLAVTAFPYEFQGVSSLNTSPQEFADIDTGSWLERSCWIATISCHDNWCPIRSSH